MFKLFTLLLQLPILLVLAVPATDTTDRRHNVAKITDFGLNGSGCPVDSGTFSAKLADHRTSIVARFDEFSPRTDSGILDTRKNCQFTVSVSIPPGKQFTITKAKYSGFVRASPEAMVSHASSYYFQGQVDTPLSSDELAGPIRGYKDLSNTFDEEEAIWSECGIDSVLNVNIQVVLQARGGSGFANINRAKIGPFAVRDC